MRLLEPRDYLVERVTIVGGDLNNPHDGLVDLKTRGEFMSIPTKEQANRFLVPLRGNVAILLLHDARVKVPLTRFILSCASLHSLATTVLDTDAFYCTNIERLANYSTSVTNEVLLLPEGDFEAISLLPILSSKKRALLIIDDLNSLLSLASGSRRLQQLMIIFKLLSHNATMNTSWVLATAYRTELLSGKSEPTQRSLTTFGDLIIDTEFRDGSIQLRASFKDNWPNGEYNL